MDIARLIERLRDLHHIRRDSTPLHVAIGLAHEAADALESTTQQLEQERKREAFYSPELAVAVRALKAVTQRAERLHDALELAEAHLAEDLADPVKHPIGHCPV